MRQALFLLALAPALAATPDRWVPARWQGGSLELFQDTPVNCLLIPWGKEADPGMARRARERHLAVLGVVHSAADPDALVLEGDFPEGFAERVSKALHRRNRSAVVIPMPVKGRLPRDTAAPVLATAAGAWPRVRASESETQAGPSGDPWIASNIWLARSLRAWCGVRPVWLGHLPDKPAPGDYPRAVADAAAAGARWIAVAEPGAWPQTAAYLRFFEEHAAWRAFTPAGAVAVVQDPAGQNPDMTDEYLNLITRRRVPFRIIERPALPGASLEGIRALVALDVPTPTPAERQKLTGFAENGGLVMVGPSWKPVQVKENQEYALEPCGKGRLAIYKEEAPDPQALSHELPHLLGRENLGVRLFNVASVITYLSTDGRQLLLQLVNYSSYPIESVTVEVNGSYSRARYYSPEAPAASLPLESSGGGIEITIPEVGIYGALLLD